MSSKVENNSNTNSNTKVGNAAGSAAEAETGGGPLLTEKDLELYGVSDRKGRRVGLLAAVAFHLLLAIVFLIISIRSVVRQEVSFISDHELSRRIAEDEAAKLEKIKEAARNQLDDQLAGKPLNRYRAVAVQQGKPLKDDRNTDASGLYKDAADLQERIRNAAKMDVDAASDDAPSVGGEKKNRDVPKYTGPSVLNWSLDGRSAFYLPIPVYKCKGGGDVTVRIAVGRNGYVRSASVVESSSVAESCIRDAAVAAAKRSRFSVSSTAPEPQTGQITYRFMAQ